MTLIELMLIFFYVGLFTIGGGLVAITLMYDPIVGNGLISSEQFYNMVAISESTPGPIGINMATYIGYELYGVIGGIAATFATVLPSLVIIIIIAKYFQKLQDKPLVKATFTTLRPVVAGMVLVAAVQILGIAVIDFAAPKATGNIFGFIKFPEILFYSAALVLLLKTKLHPIITVACGAVFGILFL